MPAIACVLDSGTPIDAGPATPVCGGRGGATCPRDHFCDFPSSLCGGDDGTGVCVRRPDDCLEPGGATMCGCDGREYLGECAANLNGVDVAHVGPCDSTPAASAAAWRECGPADGPAWRIEVSAAPRGSCDVRPPGTLTIGSYTIHDSHKEAALTAAQVIAKSSNVGSAKIALALPREEMHELFRRLGFGAVPRLGFPGEASGKLRPAKTWRPVEQATRTNARALPSTLRRRSVVMTDLDGPRRRKFPAPGIR